MFTKFNIVRAITAAIMITALVVSFLHIVATFSHLGAGWDRWVAPVMIDLVAIVGKVFTGTEFSAATRRAGRNALYVAGTVSLICNILAGYWEQQYGSALIGIITVSAAMWGEGMLGKAALKTRRPATTTTAPAAPAANDAEKAKRSEAARKAAATRKANAVAKATVPAPRTAPAAEMVLDTRAYI